MALRLQHVLKRIPPNTFVAQRKTGASWAEVEPLTRQQYSVSKSGQLPVRAWFRFGPRMERALELLERHHSFIVHGSLTLARNLFEQALRTGTCI